MIRILVPVDFSEVSINALKTAADIAKESAEHILTIVHVYERKYIVDLSMSGSGSGLMLNKEETIHIQEELTHKMRTLIAEPFLKSLNIKTLILADIHVEEITMHEKLMPQDLVIMGTHGIKGVKNFFLGSNAQKMMRNSLYPVLSVKDYKKLSFNNIAFVSSFSEQSKSHFEALQKIVAVFNSRVTFLKIITPTNFETSKDTLDAMKAFASQVHIKHAQYEIYNHTSVEGGVRSFAEENQVDIIAMETHGRTGFDHLIFGSLTEELSEDLSIPVISIKMKK